MSSSVPDTFKGFAISSSKTWNEPKLVSYKRKPILSTDVVVKNICCGVCASDVHTVRESWAPIQRDDLVVGHEIVGHVVEVGDDVKTIKVGDRIGIGASTSACGECRRCKSDNENYCAKVVSTYNAPDSFSDGYITQGGYASHSIASEKFCFPIPEKLDSHVAAPLMCAGLTVYSPLVRIIGHLSHPVVAVVGIGGLGHLALQFAKALGAEVYAFSRGSSKKADALSLGADGFIATQEEDGWEEKYQDKFDLVLNCASGADDFPVEKYLQTLAVGGTLHSAGLPPSDETFSVHPMSFLLNFSSLSSSHLGSKKEALDMLKLSADKGIKPLIQEIPITAKGAGEALTKCDNNDVRYRFVLTDFEKAFA
ncbi:GroES-like protein [Metschnikowia bicuspidata var. bicuspidata NRRL YB-4993]|uniref:GroES-like protein n=1 Tax=Metschnikowia bicuspidata var. bicuspidata NRRL YB-4993 TaxID=869754 RepID=A0A1A0HH49_9ASCO|nr:GroES-like protein [Metschnikowia bicuspidata var. bicuspidata NRRL YB-4993]OBA23504.1 GroES-like protein [Metschnikowia bicuspidata var. bicuspidata NRRL YB-4993]